MELFDDDDPKDEDANPPGTLNVSLSDSSGGDQSANQLRTATLHRVWELCGFEMETDLRIHGGQLAYGETIFTPSSGNWCIKIDGLDESGNSGVLEFVIFAQLEWDTLRETIDTVAELALSAQAVLNRGECTFGALLDEWNQEGARSRQQCRVSTNLKNPARSCYGAPQVTMGIPLARLAQVLVLARDLWLKEFDLQRSRERVEEWIQRQRERRGEHREIAEQEIDREAMERCSPTPECHLVVMQPVLLRGCTLDGVDLVLDWGAQARRELPRNVHSDDFDKALGLMSLIIRYLNEGYYRMYPAKYAKSLFAVMSRTHFAAMYRALGTAQELFRHGIQEVLGRWADGADLSIMRVCRAGFRDPELAGKATKGRKNLRPGDTLDHGGVLDNGGDVTFHGPTIPEWIASIIDPKSVKSKDQRTLDAALQGMYRRDSSMSRMLQSSSTKDLMSRGTVAYNSVSMGLFDLRRIEGVDFVVVEFREWPKTSLHPRYWKSLIGRVWTFFYQHCWMAIEAESVDLSEIHELGLNFDESLLMRLEDESGLSIGHGECLFNSVLLSGVVPQHHTTQTLRRLVAQELEQNWHRYVDFLPNDVSSGDDMMALIQNAAHYLAQPGNWRQGVADLAPVALANALRQPILIVQPGRSDLVGPRQNDNMITVHYNGFDHYSPEPEL